MGPCFLNITLIHLFISFFTLGSLVQVPRFLAWVIATVSKVFWCPLFCPSALHCKVWPHSFQRETMKYRLLLPQTSPFSSVQSLSHVRLFVTPWTAACQASLSIANSQSLPKLMSIELVMPSNHLTLCRPLLLPPSIFPSIGLFQWVSSLHQVAKVLAFQLQNQPFQWIFRTYFL